MKKTIIKGTGRYVPPRVVTNHDLVQWMDTSDEWIRQRTGIEERHWVPEEGGVGSSDLGLEAAKTALKRAGWKPEDIDLIIFATLSPDIYFPGPGCLLQHNSGTRYPSEMHRVHLWFNHRRCIYPKWTCQQDSFCWCGGSEYDPRPFNAWEGYCGVVR